MTIQFASQWKPSVYPFAVVAAMRASAAHAQERDTKDRENSTMAIRAR
jgi:hypothetical protein